MELSRATYDELRELVRRLCGVEVGEDKAYLVQHRLEPLARGHGCRSFAELADRLRRSDGSPLHDSVVELITTSETSFFRDGHPFEAVRRHLLPRLGRSGRFWGRQPRRNRVLHWWDWLLQPLFDGHAVSADPASSLGIR